MKNNNEIRRYKTNIYICAVLALAIVRDSIHDVLGSVGKFTIAPKDEKGGTSNLILPLRWGEPPRVSGLSICVLHPPRGIS